MNKPNNNKKKTLNIVQEFYFLYNQLFQLYAAYLPH